MKKRLTDLEIETRKGKEIRKRSGALRAKEKLLNDEQEVGKNWNR